MVAAARCLSVSDDTFNWKTPLRANGAQPHYVTHSPIFPDRGQSELGAEVELEALHLVTRMFAERLGNTD